MRRSTHPAIYLSDYPRQLAKENNVRLLYRLIKPETGKETLEILCRTISSTLYIIQGLLKVLDDDINEINR
jgi:hypothetical protein